MATLDFATIAKQLGYTGPEGMESQFLNGLIDATGKPTGGEINAFGAGSIGQQALGASMPSLGPTDPRMGIYNESGSTPQIDYHSQLVNSLDPASLQEYLSRAKVSDPGFLNDIMPMLAAGALGGVLAPYAMAGGFSGTLGGGGALAGGAGDATLLGSAGADTLGTGAAFGGDIAGTTAAGEVLGSGAVTGAGLGPTGGSILDGILGSINPTNVLSGVLQGGLGVLGAGQQADAYENVANQNLALGAPYRGLLEQSYGPEFDLWSQPGYADAFQNASDMAAKSVSSAYGNPYGNPGAMGQISNQVLSGAYLPALSNYRGQLGQFGGLGLNTAGAAQMGGAQTSGGAYDALGYGIGTALNQQPDWTKILQQMGGGNSIPNITLGGNLYRRGG